MAERSSSVPHGPLLLSLPPPLLHLIISFLPLSNKLSAYSHVHPSLPPLTPSSFRHNTLHLTPSTFRALELYPTLLPLLSHIPSLTSHLSSSDDEAFDVNPSHPLSPSPLPPLLSSLTHLTTLRLSLTGDTAWTSSLLHRLLTSTPLPHTRTLHLTLHLSSDHRLIPNLSHLSAAFPSLRHLHLQGAELDRASFAGLCGLRVRVLDVRMCTLYALEHVVVRGEEEGGGGGEGGVVVPGCGRWRALMLPDSSAAYEPVLCRLMETYVDTVLAGGGGGGEEKREEKEVQAEEEEEGADDGPLLSHLTYNARLAPHTLRILTGLRSLTSLDLAGCPTASDDLTLSSLYTSSLQPLLPRLRRFLHWQPLRFVVSTRNGQRTSTLPAVYAAYHGFLTAYSEQLRVLELVVPQSVPFISVLLLQLLHCPLLNALKLVAQPFPATQTRLEATSSPPRPLLQLHSLSLQSVPLFVGELGAFASLCPALEDVELSNLPLCPPDGLSALARGCPRLRRLRMLGCNGDMLRRRKETELNSCGSLLTSSSSATLTRPPLPALLPCLTFLQVTPTPLPPLLRLLLPLPCLRYFDHAASTNYLPLQCLHLLAELPHLAGVNLGRLHMEGGANAFFERRGMREEGEWDGDGDEAWWWRERVKSAVEMKRDFMRQCSAWRPFVVERRFAGDMDGKAAFFQWQEREATGVKVDKSGRGGRVK